MKFGVSAARSAALTPNFMAQISNAAVVHKNTELCAQADAVLSKQTDIRALIAQVQRLLFRETPVNRGRAYHTPLRQSVSAEASGLEVANYTLNGLPGILHHSHYSLPG